MVAPLFTMRQYAKVSFKFLEMVNSMGTPICDAFKFGRRVHFALRYEMLKPSSGLIGLNKSFMWRAGLHSRASCQATFDMALTARLPTFVRHIASLVLPLYSHRPTLSLYISSVIVLQTRDIF